MKHMRYLLPLGALLMAIVPAANAGQGVQLTYFLNAQFRCENGVTTQGYSVYVVGGRPELGNWDPAKAVKLDPFPYPAWAGTLKFTGANPGDVVEWKCIVRSDSNPADVRTWQPGSNNRVTMAFSPTAESTGSF